MSFVSLHCAWSTVHTTRCRAWPSVEFFSAVPKSSENRYSFIVAFNIFSFQTFDKSIYVLLSSLIWAQVHRRAGERRDGCEANATATKTEIQLFNFWLNFNWSAVLSRATATDAAARQRRTEWRLVKRTISTSCMTRIRMTQIFRCKNLNCSARIDLIEIEWKSQKGESHRSPRSPNKPNTNK